MGIARYKIKRTFCVDGRIFFFFCLRKLGFLFLFMRFCAVRVLFAVHRNDFFPLCFEKVIKENTNPHGI